MSQMIYKHGGEALVWGKKATVKVVDEDEVDEHLEDGWLDHPSKLFDAPEPEQKKKPGPKPKKAETNESEHLSLIHI